MTAASSQNGCGIRPPVEWPGSAPTACGASHRTSERRARASPPKESFVSKPVVLIAEELSPATVDALGPDFEIRNVDGTDRPALLAAIADANAILVRSATKVDAEAIAAAPKLKVIARAGVGLDNVDIKSATDGGRDGRERADLEHHLGRRAHGRPHPEPRPAHPGRALRAGAGGVEAVALHGRRALREDDRHHRPRAASARSSPRASRRSAPRSSRTTPTSPPPGRSSSACRR